MKNFLLFAVLCLVWGSTWLAIKIGVSQVDPLWSAGTRFFIAGFLLLIWHVIKYKELKVNKEDIVPFIKLSVSVISITFGLIYWGEQWVSSGLTAVLVQGLIPIFMYVFSLLYRYDKIDKNKNIGIILGLVGIIVVFFPSLNKPDNFIETLGMLSIIFGTVVYCWGSVTSKEVLSKYSPITVSGLENLIGGAILIIISLVLENPDTSSLFSPVVFFSWLYLVVIGSIVGFTVYITLLKELGAIKVSVYSFITPIIALILGYFTYDEEINLYDILGTLIILCGVWFIFKSKKESTATRISKSKIIKKAQ